MNQDRFGTSLMKFGCGLTVMVWVGLPLLALLIGMLAMVSIWLLIGAMALVAFSLAVLAYRMSEPERAQRRAEARLNAPVRPPVDLTTNPHEGAASTIAPGHRLLPATFASEGESVTVTRHCSCGWSWTAGGSTQESALDNLRRAELLHRARS